MKSLGQSPYFLQLIASPGDNLIFCSPPFGKGGLCKWLYRYSSTTNELVEMTSSRMYNPYYTGGVISADQTKIALVPWQEGEDKWGKEIGFINLINDSYFPLKSLSSESDSVFLSCDDVFCGPLITWKDEQSLTAEVDPVCAKTNSCSPGSKAVEVQTIYLGN